MPENSFGNWSNFLPMVAGWILLVAMFVIAIALIAMFTRKVTGWDGNHTDD
jgi:hypothetical protein